MQPSPPYSAPDAGQPQWWGPPPAPWGPTPTPPPWAAGPWWGPAPVPRRPRSRKAVVAVVAAGVLAVAVLGAVIVGAVAMGRDMGAGFAEASAGGAVPLPSTAAPSAATGLGEDPGLDTYAVRCHDGDMQACDDLLTLSDPMSRYEQYGMTCGGRVKPFDVAYCTDLG